MGNDAGDDFGKSALQDRISTNLFLGDELGKCLDDEGGKCFSPGFSGLLRLWFYWSLRVFLVTTLGISGFCMIFD
ncbi:MAG: hypothetical protein NTZ75_04925 [Euryarchaeota archaeon]|nr:hypothetical protein [Euryarchaeota archaeon]